MVQGHFHWQRSLLAAFWKAGQTLTAAQSTGAITLPQWAALSVSTTAHSSYSWHQDPPTDGLIPSAAARFARNGSCFYSSSFLCTNSLDHTNLPRSLKCCDHVFPRLQWERGEGIKIGMLWGRKRFESSTAVYKLRSRCSPTVGSIYRKHHHQKMSFFKRRDDSIHLNPPKSNRNSHKTVGRLYSIV